jgi:exodeoxyribonuclease-3
MRIATWNVNSLKARMPRVEEWLDYAQPDVLCLQETKLADSAFPALAFEGLGYTTAHHGEGRWNGVAVLSRVGLDDVVFGFDDTEEPDTDARMLWATCGPVRVCSVYVPNGREVGHDHYRYKLGWLARLRAVLDARCDPAEPLVIAGDYNIAPTDDDVWDIKAFDGSTHVTEPERDALAALEEWGLEDAFRRLHPEPGLFSYWDYRAGMFHKRQGMRIDLVLATKPVVEATTFTLIDRQARKGTLPSDHAPVLIDVDTDRFQETS